MFKEKLKEESIARMHILSLKPDIIDAFTISGEIYCTEPDSSTHPATEEQKSNISEFETESGNMVYHVIHSFSDFGEMFSFLYVPRYIGDWDEEKQYLLMGIAFAYVHNKDNPICSELGSIGIKECSGGVIRTR